MSPFQSPGWLADGAVCLLLALAVWVVFGQTWQHEFFNYDDRVYVCENPMVTEKLTADGVVRTFRHAAHLVVFPLTTLSHRLDWQLYGANPGGHHLTNVLLHAANAILLFLGLRMLTGARWPAAFVAAAFAIHPLRAESVAWVTERKDVLSGLFFMLTLWAYARYAAAQRLPGQLKGGRPAAGFYLLALVFYTCGLLSKSMLVTLPFVLLLLDYWPLKRLPAGEAAAAGLRRRAWLGLGLEKIPFLLLAAAASAVTVRTLQSAVNQSVQDLSVPWRMGNALLAYTDYLRHIFYPVGLALIYPHPGQHLPPGQVGLSAMGLLLISAGCLAGRRKHPYLLVGWLWYLGMLVPVIDGLQAGNQARADRYTYLPQIGLNILLAWGVVSLGASWRNRRAGLGIAAAAVLGSLLVAAHIQVGYWKNSASLWRRSLACTPENSLAENNLGVTLAGQGESAEAIRHYARALQIKPDYAEAHNNWGITLHHLGRLPEAVQHYERAIQLKPDYAEAHCQLGNVLADQGKSPDAIQHYERAIALWPDYAEAHYNLGCALDRQGKLPEAMQRYEQAVRLKPGHAEAHHNLGNALAGQGKLAAAVQHYEAALAIKPDFALGHDNLGNALARLGRLPEAVRHYERALQLEPYSAAAHYDLATVRSALRTGASDQTGLRRGPS
ncbi:MAG: tetratricopeptide repeat protein [Verrucomicrobia bacterium]|nr:tetratricopeptide repeat protein [Verrucomicrobiota bacterium]